MPEGQVELVENGTEGTADYRNFRHEKGVQIFVAAGIYAGFMFWCGTCWMVRRAKKLV